jgi:hypothetical protein
MKFNREKAMATLCICLFPILLAIFAALYKLNREVYLDLLSEDNAIEWIGFFMLGLTGLISLAVALIVRKRFGYYHWFFFAFTAFCLFSALEEISWGQRVFNVESTDFFLQYSDQMEINVHNVLQKIFQVKTKHIAAIALTFYGAILPVVNLNLVVRDFFKRIRLLIPPTYLIPGFLLGALMMIDKPSGREEEIGELFFSLCLFLFIFIQSRTLSSLQNPHA